MKIDQFGTPKIAKALKGRVELVSKSGQNHAKSRKSTQNSKMRQKGSANFAKTFKERSKTRSESENSVKITKTLKERSKIVNSYEKSCTGPLQK